MMMMVMMMVMMVVMMMVMMMVTIATRAMSPVTWSGKQWISKGFSHQTAREEETHGKSSTCSRNSSIQRELFTSPV